MKLMEDELDYISRGYGFFLVTKRSNGEGGGKSRPKLFDVIYGRPLILIRIIFHQFCFL